MNVLVGIIIPFIGTTLGSAMCFFMKDKMNKKIEKFLLGFAAGVMIAASVWSLILPSIEMAESQCIISWIPATIGFLLGIIFLLWIDFLISHLNQIKEKKFIFSKKNIMVLAITLHNIPEGMAVGVAFAGALAKNSGITLASATALAIGIAIQNFPEGSIISMPLRSEGMSKIKSFLLGTLSGIVEPVGAAITIALTDVIVPMLPYFLSFAAGAMIYVVVKELIPESQNGEHADIGIIGITIGFLLMMILDVALK